jgi:ribokinase
MRRPVITVVGSIHVDYTVKLPRLPSVGETVIGVDFKKSPGGKGANQAVAAARLNAETYIVSRVGADEDGQMLLDNLRRNGVHTEYVKIDPTSYTGIALIMVDAQGRNMIAVASGTDAKVSKEDVDLAMDCIRRSDMVLAQLEIPIETTVYALEKAYEAGVRTVLNPAPCRPLPKDLYRKISVITPNRVELSMLTGMPTRSLKEIEEAARSILDLGVENIVVTLGEEGALIVDPSSSTHVKAIRVEAVDTTGAGDAFNAALAVALAEGKSLKEAVFIANAAAALKITKIGAQEGLPRRTELEEFLSKITSI